VKKAAAPTVPRRLASLADAAAYAGVNPRTLRRYVATGHLTGHRLGPRLLRIDLNELDAALRPVPTVPGDPHHAYSR